MPRMNKARAGRWSGWVQDPREPKDKSWFVLGTDRTAHLRNSGQGGGSSGVPDWPKVCRQESGWGELERDASDVPCADTGPSSGLLKLEQPERREAGIRGAGPVGGA